MVFHNYYIHIFKGYHFSSAVSSCLLFKSYFDISVHLISGLEYLPAEVMITVLKYLRIMKFSVFMIKIDARCKYAHYKLFYTKKPTSQNSF